MWRQFVGVWAMGWRGGLVAATALAAVVAAAAFVFGGGSSDTTRMATGLGPAAEPRPLPPWGSDTIAAIQRGGLVLLDREGLVLGRWSGSSRWRSVALAPDRTSAFITDDVATLSRVDLRDGAQEVVAELAEWAAVSPDGGRLAWVRLEGDGVEPLGMTVVVRDLLTGAEQEWRDFHGADIRDLSWNAAGDSLAFLVFSRGTEVGLEVWILDTRRSGDLLDASRRVGGGWFRPTFRGRLGTIAVRGEGDVVLSVDPASGESVKLFDLPDEGGDIDANADGEILYIAGVSSGLYRWTGHVLQHIADDITAADW
jgi:hypothetical protein